MKKIAVIGLLFIAGLVYAGVVTVKNYSESKNVTLNSADKIEVRVIPEGTTGYILLEYTVGGTEKIDPVYINMHGEIVNE